MDGIVPSPSLPDTPAGAPNSPPPAPSNPAPLSHERRASHVSAGGVNFRPANAPAGQPDRQLNNSQESILSNSSFSTKPPGLFSSSNVSTATVQTVDTDSTSPPSPEQLNGTVKGAIDMQNAAFQRPHTPGMSCGSKDAGSEQVSSTSTSPMSVEAPYLNKGSKRTASGAIKSAMSIQTAMGINSGKDVMQSPTGRSPKDLAQALKTRLSYAMVKVQNGWENLTLDELEAMTERSMPSTPARSRAGTGTGRRLSMLSEFSEPYLHSPAAAAFSHSMPNSMHGPASADYQYQAKASAPRVVNGRSLEPAAPISSRSHRRSLSSKPPPMLSATSIPRSSVEYPSTPRRQGILRMPSKQDEKDAVDTLMFMSSPNNSNNTRYSSSAQASPLRSEFPSASTDYAVPPKKVLFETGLGGMSHMSR